jgi:hypothetical protein
METSMIYVSRTKLWKIGFDIAFTLSDLGNGIIY